MNRTTAIAIVVLAVSSRLIRAVCRWEEWALHYSAYNLETFELIQAGDWATALQTWAGLHPPLYPILHALGSTLWPAPFTWLVFSALCSACAVVFLMKAHPGQWLPPLLLATDPVQLHYAAEVNNYPLSVLLVSIAWWGLQQNRLRWMIVAGIIAMWTHILAGVCVLFISVMHKQRAIALGGIFLGASPLALKAWQLATDVGTHIQPPLLLEASISDSLSRFSLAYVILLPVLILGFARAKDAACVWIGMLCFWFGMVGLHIAAPHQFPYALMLGIPAAVLISASARYRTGLTSMVTLVAISRFVWFEVGDFSRIMNIQADQQNERAIDVVFNLSLPGDAIVLIRGPGKPDDDRRHFSPTIWRMSPFQPMPSLSTGVRPDLMGQPRLVRGRRLYTYSQPRPSMGTIPGDHVFTILYDGAEERPEIVPDHPLQGDWEPAGPDLWRGPVFTAPSSAPTVEPVVGASDGTPSGPPVSE
ncbi:MAG: hypothetical protein CL930_06275 [Deltaproteobacteria bacterium]|nr:hypothetical protein [Deltaproteobacteria bacterium]